MTLDDLVFVGFNRRVLALDRETGETIWQWKAPKSSSCYVTLLFDVDRLIVSVDGFIYCLDPSNGDQLWDNPTKGCGYGVASIATVRGCTPHDVAAKMVQKKSQDESTAHHSPTT